MSKRFQIVRDKMPTPDGSFIEAIRIALFEFACLGERRFDISGYPYESASEAFEDDWQALGADAKRAATIVIDRDEPEGGSNGEGQKQGTSAG